MKLVRVALPLAATLAVGTAGLSAVQASPLSVPPPASAPKPSALLPVPSSRVFVLLPAPTSKTLALPPALAPKAVVPAPKADTEYKGARIMLRSMPDIPRCYFVLGLQSRAGVVEVTDRAGRPLPHPARPQVSSSAGRPPAPR